MWFHCVTALFPICVPTLKTHQLFKCAWFVTAHLFRFKNKIWRSLIGVVVCRNTETCSSNIMQRMHLCIVCICNLVIKFNVFRMYLSMRALAALEKKIKKEEHPEGTVLRFAPLVDCTSFSIVWYQIISKQRAPSIICRGGAGEIFSMKLSWRLRPDGCQCLGVNS